MDMSGDAPLFYKDYGEWVLKHHAEDIRQAQILNGIIGVWYMLFAGLFVVAAFVVIRSYMSPRYHQGRRRADPPGTYFRENPRVPPLGWGVVLPFYGGAMAFFIGCGLHHWHIALEDLPSGYSEMWHGYHMMLGWAQALGAPTAGIAAFYIIKRFQAALRGSEAAAVSRERRQDDRPSAPPTT